MEQFFKQILPKSLLARSLLILVVPLVLLQVISAFLFYEAHWDKISRNLSRGLAGDIGMLTDLVRNRVDQNDLNDIYDMARSRLSLNVKLNPEGILTNTEDRITGRIPDLFFLGAMEERVGLPFHIIAPPGDKTLLIQVQLAQGVLEISAKRNRLFSSTTYVFVIWMVGSSLILFGVAIIFMRNQVRPIRRLARAADAFGKRQNVEHFKPEGAREVRQAASAFLTMKERIERQIEQRTHMLSGVSHDLRTPLTRMKLQLAMMSKEDEDIEELSNDVSEMEHMLEGYLAFARGEGGEEVQVQNLTRMIDEIVSATKRRGALIDYHSEGQIELPVRPNAFRRCVTNLIENAVRYGSHASVRVGIRTDAIEISIDDNGPGIPPDKREDVFKPFFRLDSSRNIETGGVGLGLSIVRDVVRNHGGDAELSDSPLGGLRARLRFPL